MFRYICFFYILLLYACSPGEVVESQDLKIEFENLWWQVLDIPEMILYTEKNMCLKFTAPYYVEPPDDGAIIYYEEGDNFSYILTNFERLEQGYYISEYDVDLEVLVDEDGIYFVKLSLGILNHTSQIIPCTL